MFIRCCTGKHFDAPTGKFNGEHTTPTAISLSLIHIYNAPCQRVGDFLGTESNSEYTVEPTYKPNVTWVNLDEVFPKFITDSMREGIVLMDNKLHGFADNGAVITGPETRSSSPVRIIRDKKTMQSNIKGLYPCGEGAGYAGGIMSAAVDGIKTAEMVVINNGRGKNEQ